MKAVIMCGGMGSRLKPLTETTPKPLVKVMNRPVLDIIIDKLISSGINDISLSLGYKAEDIIEFCNNKNYSAEINYVVEKKPLGTAGGVKKCIQKTDEDVIVLSGDNIFDFDLNAALDFHNNSNADFTVCAVEVNDPREYGVIITDDDGSICSFVEKPTWEQAKCHIVNTGIYILKGKILDRIPEDTFYDFSQNLFPGFFKDEIRFMCYSVGGYWGDMGEFDSMFKIIRELFLMQERKIMLNGTFYGTDTMMNNGTLIKAPCLIGKKTVINDNAVIGPFTVIGENCVIGERSNIESGIIGDDCVIGVDTEIQSALLSDNVNVGDNCFLDSYSVIGNGCKIGRFSRVLERKKIWPGNNIDNGAVIHKDIYYDHYDKKEFNIFGLSAKVNSEFNIVDAVELGLSIASVGTIQKVGIGYDGKSISENYKNVIASGVRAAGKTCYDFGEIFKSQSYFYSSYCSLDFFIFICLDGEKINISFFGKYSMPVSSKISRQINNNYKYQSFDYCIAEDCKDIYNMKLFSVVYKSYFKKISNYAADKFDITVECENPVLQKLIRELLTDNKSKKNARKLTVLFNKSGKEMFVVENERFYSSDQILVLLCEIEMAAGNSIIIPEDAADFLEETAENYDGELFRIYESNNYEMQFDSNAVLNNVWTFDCVLLFAKLMNILNKTNCTIKELFEYQRNFAINKSEIEISNTDGSLQSLILATGAEKKDDDIYFVFENRKGKVRLRQMGNSNKIRLLSQSFDMESAKELSAFITKKIRDSNIDKDK